MRPLRPVTFNQLQIVSLMSAWVALPPTDQMGRVRKPMVHGP